MEPESTLHTDLNRPVDLCSLGGASTGERTDITVMVTSRREGLHELETKVTSDGGEAERLKSSLRDSQQLAGSQNEGQKSDRIGNAVFRPCIQQPFEVTPVILTLTFTTAARLEMPQKTFHYLDLNQPKAQLRAAWAKG